MAVKPLVGIEWTQGGESGLVETSREAAGIVQVGDSDSLDQGSGSGDGAKWVVSLTPSGLHRSPPEAFVVRISQFNTWRWAYL